MREAAQSSARPLADGVAAALAPTQFDGGCAIERLPTGRSYLVYAEPPNGAVDPSQIINATASLRRNSTCDPGWPALQSCIVLPVDISFTARTRPGQ